MRCRVYPTGIGILCGKLLVPWQSILTVISFFELVKDKRKYFEEFSRITIDAKRLTDKTTLDEYKTLLLDDILRYKKDDFRYIHL